MNYHDYSLLACDITVLSKWLPAFRGNQEQPSGMWHRKA